MKKLYVLFALLFTTSLLWSQSLHPSCAQARNLCNKAPVTVTRLQILGSQDLQPSCFNESIKQPYWFHFKPITSGTFEFVAFPQNPVNTDFDFALYEGCPNGGGGELACDWESPFLPTGLTTDPGAFGISNAPGVLPYNIDVTAGVDYYLLIDNFKANASGFTIQFGGTFKIAATDPPTAFPIETAHSCDRAPLFDCNCLDGFESGTEKTMYGGSIPGFDALVHNPHIYRFIACACVMRFDIVINGPCVQGNGIEAQVLNINPQGNCQNTPVTTDGQGTQLSPCQLTALNLVVGQAYALVIDGINGASCPYKIDITPITPAPLTYTDTLYTTSNTYCEGDTMVFTTPPIGNALYCYWTFPAGYDTLQSAHDTLLVIAGHGNGQPKQVCIVATNGCGDFATICREITVFPDTVVSRKVVVCDEDLPYAFNNQLLTDPGTYWDTLQTVHGCDSIIQLHLLVKCCQSTPYNPNFADHCSDAPLLCASFIDATTFDLANSTADIPGNLAAQFCYPIAHSRWLRFSACAITASFEMTVQSCTGANPTQNGVEIALFTTSDCLNFTRIGNCSQTNLSQTQTLTFNGLTEGNEYYLLADGIGAEVCVFTLKALDGVNTGLPDTFASTGTATDGMITGDKDVCPGQLATYTLIPPTCKATFPVFTCNPPEGACGFCGTVVSVDSFIYKWHVPACGRIIGDSTGLTVDVLYDVCTFTSDTVVVGQLWIEIIPVYADTFFVQKDTLVFCDCFGGSLSCGTIPPCDVRIHFNVEHIYLTIPCTGPAPVFMGTVYGSPGTFTKYDVPNCILYIIDVTKEQGAPFLIAPHGILTCVSSQVPLHAITTNQVTWFPSYPAIGPNIWVGFPGQYQAIATDANGCTSVATTYVGQDVQPPVANAGPDQTVCNEDAPVQLHALGGPGYYIYKWSHGPSGANVTANQTPGTTVTYTLTVTNPGNGCTNTDQTKVKLKSPILTNRPLLMLCPGDCFTLGGETFCPSPGDSPVFVTLSSFNGCDSLVQQPFLFNTPVTTVLGVIANLTCATPTALFNGVTYNQPGTYTVKINNCTYNKFVITQNTSAPPPTVLAAVVLCPGDCFTFNGQVICPVAGDPPALQTLMDANGCDSLVQQPFLFNTPITTTLGVIANLTCATPTAVFNGVTYSQPGTYTVKIDNCTYNKIVITQNISAPPPTVLPTVALCPGDCYTFNGQVICPSAGDPPALMTLLASNGCDSVITQAFVFNAPDTVALGAVATLTCAAPTATVNGVTYTQPGSYTVQLDNCTYQQFVVAQNISAPPPTVLPAVALCPGDCYTFNGQVICPAAGDPPALMTLLASNGCDSVITQTFVFNAPDTVALGTVATLTCAAPTATLNGITYTQPGTYAVQLDNCTYQQFVVAQNISAPPPTALPAVALCPGDCYTFNGQVICPAAGDPPALMTLLASNGCDSVITQTFVFNAPDTVALGTVATLTCAAPTATLNGITYTQPGTYAVQLDNCTYQQFVVAQNISAPPPTALPAVALCPGDCYTFNGQVICPAAGDPPALMTLLASNGCDSVITQAFVFNAPDTVTLGTVATLTCAAPTATLNGITYTQPGTYAVQLDNCTYQQFVVAQNISAPPPTALPTVALCPGDCYTFNGQVICPAAGDPPALMTLLASNGCDSVITQAFVFNAPDTVALGTVATLTCAAPTATVNGVIYTQPGTYAVQLDNCTYQQFVVAQNISAPPPTALPAVALCPGDCYTFNGQVICPSAGDPPALMTLLASNGCDSVITQAFVFNAPDTVALGTLATLSCKDTAVIIGGETYTQAGTYVHKKDNCTYDLFSIAANPEPCDETVHVYVPNVIQPAAGVPNGWFTIYTTANLDIKVNFLRIFDRWGNQLFLNSQFLPNVPESGWDGTFRGKPCQPGVYLFVYELLLPNGVREMKKGDVTVLR